jgi:hypothetical protein
MEVAADTKKAPKKCRIADILNCPGFHTYLSCNIFAKLALEERDRNVFDNKMCYTEKIMSATGGAWRGNLRAESLNATQDTSNGCITS